MAYIPNNQPLFIAVYSGALAGMGVSLRVVTEDNPVKYAGLAQVAGAFAIAFDIAWGPNPNTSLDFEAIQQMVQGVWEQRAVQAVDPFLDPATYAVEAEALVSILAASNTYFVAQGISPNLPSGGGVPPVANILGATIVENPAGIRVSQRLRQSFIDPDFNIASWTKTNTQAGQLLYRRGDTIGPGITATAAYITPPPVAASVADVFANGAVGAGIWTLPGPAFTAASKAGTVTGAGLNASPDPSWVATLSANDGSFFRTANFTAFFTSDIYQGESVNPAIVGTDVFNVVIQPGFVSNLQRVRNNVHTFTNVAATYDYELWPSQAQYTAGTVTFKDQNGFTFLMILIGTTPITRNGVTRTYDIWRSAGLLSSLFTVTTT